MLSKYVSTNSRIANHITCSVHVPKKHGSTLNIKNGWVNDPNGMIKYNDKYHLYFQYLPGSSRWNLGIGWGHATSTDLRNWHIENKRSLYPSRWYDQDGCFSGSVSVINNTVYAVYTGVIMEDEKLHEYQCLAYSENGAEFEKIPEPFLDTPPVSTVAGWRDPFLFNYKDCYYILLGSGWENNGYILLYKGENKFPCEKWEYKGVLMGMDDENVLECPFIAFIEDKWILGASCDKKNPVYWSGIFDGTSFLPDDSNPKQLLHNQDLDIYAPTIVYVNDTPHFWSWIRNTKKLYGPVKIVFDYNTNSLIPM
jgi:sucrose-6-phosphate hydrolase SacC (GH32 family)